MQQDDAAMQRILEEAVEEFARETRFPLAFGGFERRGAATVTSLTGNRTLSLQGLRVQSGRGLGGRALSEARPRLTADYTRSRYITHDYDGEVSREGILTLFAMPVVVQGSVRAVLYGGTRARSGPGTAFVQAANSVATAFGQELRVQEEVARRVASARPDPASELPTPLLEELRSGHAELRSIAAEVADPELRTRLGALEQRLARLGGGSAQPESAVTAGPVPPVRLTPRELDVISHAALGGTNAEIGRSLGLTESTVKSYLKTAMAKLEASTRLAAVAKARLLSLIP